MRKKRKWSVGDWHNDRSHAQSLYPGARLVLHRSSQRDFRRAGTYRRPDDRSRHHLCLDLGQERRRTTRRRHNDAFLLAAARLDVLRCDRHSPRSGSAAGRLLGARVRRARRLPAESRPDCRGPRPMEWPPRRSPGAICYFGALGRRIAAGELAPKIDVRGRGTLIDGRD